MERNIVIKVIDKVAYAPKDAKIICSNNDYKIIFEFDDEWDGIDKKTARFFANGKNTDVVFTGNSVQAPPIYNAAYVKIGVFTGEMTTTSALVKCDKSILCEGGHVAPPSEDVYSQIIELLNGIQMDIPKEVDDALEQAKESGEFDGKDGYSPSAKVEQTSEGAVITVTDKTGTTSAVVKGTKEPLTGTTKEITPMQVVQAVMKGKNVLIGYEHSVYGVLIFADFFVAASMDMVGATYTIELNNDVAICQLTGDIANGVWELNIVPLMKQSDSPTEIAGITINGVGPDENGNFIVNTLTDVEIAQLRAVIT